MRKIYAFKLNSEDVPSEVFHKNIRLIACFVYDRINDLSDFDNKNFYLSDDRLFINSSNVKYNELDEISYKFLSDDDNVSDKEKIYYDPVIIDKNIFGITIDEENDDLNMDDIIMDVMTDLYSMEDIDRIYNYDIISIRYDRDYKRKIALEWIREKLKEKEDNKSFIKRIAKRIKYSGVVAG